MLMNMVNGKVYIGETANLKKRIGIHSSGKSNLTTKITKAIIKYGWENFKVLILANCNNKSQKERVEIEGEQIKKHDALNPKKGYNCYPKGQTPKGYKLPEKTKRKIAASMMGEKNPFYGKIHTKETKAKISKIHKGKTISKEHKLKVSIPVIQIFPDGSTKEYCSMIEAAKILKGKRCSIAATCRGKRDLYRGCRWVFKKDLKKD